MGIVRARDDSCNNAPILQHGMQPLVWGGDSHFDHLDRQSLLAEGEGGGLGGHPNVESVVVFSVQPVVDGRPGPSRKGCTT